MTYRVHQKNKKTGVVYVYEATAVWDKEKKQPRNKQVCIGKIDPDTGEFVPSKRLDPKQAAARDPEVTAISKVVGPELLLDSVTEKLELRYTLKACFPGFYKQILSLAQFLACRGGALSHFETWSKSHSHCYADPLTTQRISEILNNIDENSMQAFFKRWARKTMENDYLCYDITSVSSYSELNEYLRYGYNRDGEKLKQINLAMLFGQNSRLPVFYRRLPGNISDVSTLHNFLDTFSFLELPQMSLVMDKGFFSQNNIDALFAVKDRFTIAVPTRVKWLQEFIDSMDGSIQSPQNYLKTNGETLYVHSEKFVWGENRKRCHLHVYYNAHLAADAFDGFTEELLDYKKELEENRLVAAHEKAYSDYFIISETPVRGRKIKFNDEVIQKHRKKYAGYFAILSNDIKDPVKALEVYRNKDCVEKCFDDLKNQLDMKRLRVHSSRTMDGRMFVQFIALIYTSALRKALKEAELENQYTVRELIGETETISRIEYSGKYGHIITEMTRSQKQIFEKLGIQMQS